MSRKLTHFEQYEQPINWARAFASGALGAILMAGLVDIFNMAGATHFSLERYLGLFVGVTSHPHGVWVVGALVNMVLGGLFGLLYGYAFEYVFRRSGVQLGTRLGFVHAIIAALALFPFLGLLHEQVGTADYQHFGFFGSGLDPATPILLLFAHLVFGSCMGLFYGPVREGRVRTRYFEAAA